MEGPPRQNDSPQLILRVSQKTQPEEELIIFTDNGIVSVTEYFLYRFFFMQPCQLIFNLGKSDKTELNIYIIHLSD